MTDQTPEVVKLAEDLMAALASVRAAYEMHTANHPDDEVRILTLGHTEALIHRARRVLYGEEAPASGDPLEGSDG